VVLRADLRGEGGILALMTLVTSGSRKDETASETQATPALIALQSLRRGAPLRRRHDPPAMSVLSAIEGVKWLRLVSTLWSCR
jgi:K+ transporter